MHKKVLEKIILSVTIAVIFLAYVFTLQGNPGNYTITGYNVAKDVPGDPPFATSMERGRFAQVTSIVNYHTLNVDHYPYFLKPDLAWYNGHFYAAFPVGVAVLAVPFYLIGNAINLNQVLAYFPTILYSVLTGIVILLITKKLGLALKSRIFAVLAYCLGSAAWAYTATISAHPLSALLVALGFLISLSIEKEKDNFWQFFGLWFIFAANLFIDYVSMVIFLPIIVYSLGKVLLDLNSERKFKIKYPIQLAASFSSFVGMIALFVVMNLSLYGKPLAFSNTFNLRPLEQVGIKLDYKHLSNDVFKQRPYASRFSLAGLSNGAYELLISEDRGLFYFSPVFVLAFLGFLAAIKRGRGYWAVILLAAVLDIIVYGSYDDPWGGWAFGSRYLIPVLPLLAVMCGVGFNAIKKWKVTAVISALLLFVSIGIASLGALTTTAIPPDVEAVGLHIPDNFVGNYTFLKEGDISSFVYIAAFSHVFSPYIYGIILFSFLVIVLTALFVFPLEKEQKTESEFDELGYRIKKLVMPTAPRSEKPSLDTIYDKYFTHQKKKVN